MRAWNLRGRTQSRSWNESGLNPLRAVAAGIPLQQTAAIRIERPRLRSGSKRPKGRECVLLEIMCRDAVVADTSSAVTRKGR